MNYLRLDQPFVLEAGGSLPGITIAYHTYGRLNADRSNVVWVCHALTANSDVARWWPGVVGEHGVVRPEDYFIVCANILGSCYGTTGPVGAGPGVGEHGVGVAGAAAGERIGGDAAGSGGAAAEERIGGDAAGSGGAAVDPCSGGERPLYADFPMITIRDMVRAHILLRQHLGIDRIYLLMGGSMGGYQALEWVVMEPEVIGRLFLIATSPTESAWGIAVHTAQRLAIEADSSWREARPTAGQKGLKAARAIGILTYRNYGIMVQKQTDPDAEKLDGYRASSYIEYQGKKLVERFSAHSYWLLTKAMDSHHIARGRGVGAGRVGGEGTGASRGHFDDKGHAANAAAVGSEGRVDGGDHAAVGGNVGSGGHAAVGGNVGSGGHVAIVGSEGRVDGGAHVVVAGSVGSGGHVAGEGSRRGWNEDVEAVLRGIRQKTLVIGITSDILCPFEEQRHLAAHLPDARLIEIDSAYGHDGFMVEGEKIAIHLREWLSE